MSVVQVLPERNDQVFRVVLSRPRANLLDAEMVAGLRKAVAGIRRYGPTKLVVFEGAGDHFSFGASVEEHLPGAVPDMLHRFHALFREIEDLGVPTAAAVKGQCLGGGFELALLCGRIVVASDARLGCPEVKLGVFPPAASVLLPFRVPNVVAARLAVAGEVVPGERAVTLGLADAGNDDPSASILSWFDEVLAPLSAVAVRHAWRAVRRPVVRALAEDLPAVEHAYLDDLMACHDPVEGLRAFLERRPARWEHR